MSFTMYTARWMSLGRNVTLFRQRSIRTAISWGKGMIRSFIMTARIIISRLSRKTEAKSTEKAKSTGQTRLFKWGYSWTGDGIPLAFSLFPGNANEQTSLKPLEKKVLGDFGCQKFIYCSDAGLGSEAIREYNHMGEQAYIVTQSVKKLAKEEKEWALNFQGFKQVSDDAPVDITKLPEDDKGLYYKDEPYTTKKLHQRLIITYSPKYALYQKSIRDKQVERAQKMLDSGKAKKNRKNPNDPARFIGKIAVTKEGEAADIRQYLDEDKIAEEAQYDGFYAVCTDLLDDEVGDILKVSEGRWQIEECFRIMKTDFSARPVYLRDENRIQAHFLICFLALTIYRYLEKKLDSKYTCEELLDTLKAMNFAEIQEQGFIPFAQSFFLSQQNKRMNKQFIYSCVRRALAIVIVFAPR